jgi:hypothetical protein
VLSVPDGPLPLSIHPRFDGACEPDKSADQMQRRALRGYAECMLTLIPLLIAALSSAPAPVVIVLAVLFVVALIRWIRLAPPPSGTHR